MLSAYPLQGAYFYPARAIYKCMHLTTDQYGMYVCICVCLYVCTYVCIHVCSCITDFIGSLLFCFSYTLQRLGMSNKNICLLGICMGICGSLIISDWQSVRGDPCDQYSYGRLKAVSSNLTSNDSCGSAEEEALLGVLQHASTTSCSVSYVLYVTRKTYLFPLIPCGNGWNWADGRSDSM